MDELDRLVDWLWEFFAKWLKIVVTVACLSTILVGSMMFGIGGVVLLKTLSFDVKAVKYVLAGLLFMIVCPIFIHRTWSGRWLFFTRWVAKRKLSQQNFIQDRQ
ncbi:hypothetical protein [Ralstonia pickettii]|jgi:hypothetical protein|uniref:hypothetical protein n=1 Tax=Ralstonia pickettii TaxID=329 RepID=UPI0012EED752|nr:hypothetical protein [Ralstonia pickettii]